jgi:hypothetical protein
MRRVSPRTPFHRVAGSLGIVSMGFYAHHLRSWLEHLDPRQLHVIVGEEDLGPRAGATVAGVYAHLGVDATFEPQGIEERIGQRASAGRVFLNYYAPRGGRRLLRRIPGIDHLPAPSGRVTAADRAHLRALYAPDVAELEHLLDRPLGCWRTAPHVAPGTARSRSA